MKILNLSLVMASSWFGALAAPAQQPANAPQPSEAAGAAVSSVTNVSVGGTIEVTNATPATNAPATTSQGTNGNGMSSAEKAEGNTTNANGTNTPPTTVVVPKMLPPSEVITLPNGDKGLRLNFRGVPLEMVLNYLSKAAGFIINLETEVKGKVDVWSEQPVSVDRAVDLLNSILNKNGYAAIRNGNILTIVSRDDAKKREIPVKKTSDPEEIPRNDEMATYIIPVRYANAVQMTKDLQPLLPSFAQLSANESGNALVLTDVQSDIKRMAEIVKALDTSISGISTIRVFPLTYADAKDLASEIKELFPAPSGSTGGGRGGGGPQQMFMARFGGGPGGRGGGGGGDGSSGQSEARQAASRVTAVADERTNSLVVGAPEEIMDTIEKLVQEVDRNAENITEVRVFHLKYADPVEMADELTNLFPDTTRTDSARSSFQFGRGGFGGRMFGGGNTAQTANSTRSKQQGKVLAVPDQRTASVIVSAAKDLMPEIEGMITQLDANPAKKQKVYVYTLDNADSDSVSAVLQDMFQSQQNRNNSRQNQNNNALNMRQNQAAQSIGQNMLQNNGRSSFGNRGGSSLP